MMIMFGEYQILMILRDKMRVYEKENDMLKNDGNMIHLNIYY